MITRKAKNNNSDSDIETKKEPLEKSTDECFSSNGDVYPLCVGNGSKECSDCCVYEDYELYHSPYGE